MRLFLILLALATTPEPESRRYVMAPDAVIVLDGKVVASIRDVPEGSECVVHTSDLHYFGFHLRGPVDRVFATSPKKESP